MYIKKYYHYNDHKQFVIDFTCEQLRIVQKFLMYCFGLLAIVAGFGKFTNYLVDWKKYIAAPFVEAISWTPSRFIGAIGLIEICAGILVLLKPRIGSYVIMIWLSAIAISLLAQGKYVDVAVRDLMIAAGAFALAMLSRLLHALSANSSIQQKQATVTLNNLKIINQPECKSSKPEINN
jgi:hypothetical protein